MIRSDETHRQSTLLSATYLVTSKRKKKSGFWRILSGLKFYLKILKKHISRNNQWTVNIIGSLTLLFLPLPSHTWFSIKWGFWIFLTIFSESKILSEGSWDLLRVQVQTASTNWSKKFLERRKFLLSLMTSPSHSIFLKMSSCWKKNA